MGRTAASRLRRQAGYGGAFKAWLRDLRRDATRNRVRRFGQALVLAHELPAGIRRLHAHFLHTPASVARYASALTGLPWSCSAHAKDIWTTPVWEKTEKLRDLEWLVTCTRVGRDHLAALAPQPERIELAYHGLDFERFPPPDTEPSRRDGSAEDDPVVVLTVGRAVEKKGFDVLLRALAGLPSDLHWRLVHIGGGALRRALSRQAEACGLGRRIAWLGPSPQDTVIRHYRAADLFVLPCRVARDGDRDGIPNVLMEAQSQGLACISTRVSAVPELIEDGVTGLLVPPDDDAALAAALKRLMTRPRLRARLAAQGRQRVQAAFSVDPGIDRIAARLDPGFGDTRPCA